MGGRDVTLGCVKCENSHLSIVDDSLDAWDREIARCKTPLFIATRFPALYEFARPGNVVIFSSVIRPALGISGKSAHHSHDLCWLAWESGYFQPGNRHRNIIKKNSQPLAEFPVCLGRKRGTFEAEEYLPITL
jgi:hypothetical protein